MKDFILEISYDAADTALEDLVQARLFLTASSGSSSVEANGTATVSAYFDSAAARDEAATSFDDLHVTLRCSEHDQADWLQLYQQSLQALMVGRSFVIAPEASLIPRDTMRHRLVIPQEQAFGTGSHESTALAIELLEEIDLRGRRVLDIGSGSGILALAMLRLGARKAIAFDIDLDAFRSLRENRVRNAIGAEGMPLFIGTLDALRGGRFEVIAMNILPEVILPLLLQVKMHLGGTLILSGIVTTFRIEVLSECQHHSLRLVQEREKGEWWAGSFRLEA